MSKKSYTYTRQLNVRGRTMFVGEPEEYMSFACDICGVETLAKPDSELILLPRHWEALAEGKHRCGRCIKRKKVLV